MSEKVNILITLNGFGNSIKNELSKYIEKQSWSNEVRLISVIPTTTMREQSLKGILYNEIMPDRTIDEFGFNAEETYEEPKPKEPERSDAPPQIVKPIEQPEKIPNSIKHETPKPFKFDTATIKEEVKAEEVEKKLEEKNKPKESIF